MHTSDISLHEDKNTLGHQSPGRNGLPCKHLELDRRRNKNSVSSKESNNNEFEKSTSTPKPLIWDYKEYLEWKMTETECLLKQ